MTRDGILFMVVAVYVGFTPAWLDGSSVARAQASATTVGATADLASEGWVLRETFDDNRTSKLWDIYRPDPNCKVTETNKRLEFTAVEGTENAFAGYVGSDWWIDPNRDFSMKVELYHDLVTLDGAWISFGLTPTPDQPRGKYVSLGVGCVNKYSNYWHEWRDGYELRSDFASRVQNRVTLYMSYNASEDKLYVSDTGYSPEEAWQVFPDMIWGRWRRAPLFVFLGGTVDGAKIDPGHLYLDEFVIESGVVVKEGQTTDPNQPTDPNSPPGGTDVDILVPVLITPTVFDRAGSSHEFSALASLPAGIRPADVDLAEFLVLMPARLAAERQTTFLTLTGATGVMGAFSTDELLAVTDDGRVDLQLVGRLKDGRSFGGTQRVTVR